MNRPVIVFFDGRCNMCNGSVRFILDRDGKNRFRFASLQSDFARNFFHDLEFDPEACDSMVVFDGKRCHVMADAVIAISKRLPGIWRMGVLLRIVPKKWRNAAYCFVARRRYRFFGRRKSCRIPAPEEASRFLG